MKLLTQIASQFKPPPDLTISDWAEKKIRIENSSMPGRWRKDSAPFQAPILDAVGDPTVKRVTLISAAQIGKTLLQAIVTGYYMEHDPAPSVMVFPTKDDVRTFCKQKLYPFVNGNPDLMGLTGLLGGKQKSNNTLEYIEFPGGFLALVGSNSPSGLAMKSCRFLNVDEVDRFAYSAGEDGDPILLARKRQASFWNAKELMTSTPLLKDTSRVYASYLEGTQSQWCLPCPDCGAFNELDFWRLNLEATDIKEQAVLACKDCGSYNDQVAWFNNKLLGKFVPLHPERHEHISFHVNALGGPFANWEQTIQAYLAVKDKGTTALQTFWNLELGWPYEQLGEAVNEGDLLSRVEPYAADCPRGVMILTASVDVQKDRVELKIKGWGLGEESWLIDRRVFWGDPLQLESLQTAEHYIDTTFFKHEFGYLLKVKASCWDVGFLQSHMEGFLRGKEVQYKFGIKGSSNIDAPFIKHPSMRKGVKKHQRKIPIYDLGVGEGKRIVYARLMNQQPGPQYMHFNEKLADAQYFKQLTAEKLVITFEKNKRKEAWVNKRGDRRNEALDLEVYALAALRIYHPNWASLHKQWLAAEQAYFEALHKQIAPPQQQGLQPPNAVDLATEPVKPKPAVIKKSGNKPIMQLGPSRF